MRRLIYTLLLVAIPIFRVFNRISGTVAANSTSEFTANNVNDECLAIASMASMDISNGREKQFAQAVRSGFWVCAKSILASVQTSHVADYASTFDVEERVVLNEIASLKSVIATLLPVPSINCPFKWAQSSTEIMLSVKFSHKIDAPATLNVIAKNVSLTSDRLVLLASNGAKNFHLDITFLDPVVPAESTWSMASVGRMTFTIKKMRPPSKWSSLTKDNKKLPQMHVWWDIQEKYSSELEKLDEVVVKSKSVEAEPTEPLKESGKVSADNGDVIAEKAADTNSDLTGKIQRTPDERRVDEDLKKKMAAIADSAMSRKKLIDQQARKDKDDIDTEMAAQILALEDAKSVPATATATADSFDEL